MKELVLENYSYLKSNYNQLTEDKKRLLEAVYLEQYMKQVYIIEGIGGLLSKFVSKAKQLIKSPEANLEKLKALRKTAKPAINQLQKKVPPKKIAKYYKQKYQELGQVKDETKDSSLIMKVIKFIVFGPAIVGLMIHALFSPIMWMLLYMIKSYAVRQHISLIEAFKRYFKFSISIITKKWSPMFVKRLVIQLLLMLGVVTIPVASVYLIFFSVDLLIHALKGGTIADYK